MKNGTKLSGGRFKNYFIAADKANYFSFNEKDFPFVIKYIGKDFDMKDICLTYLKYIYEK